MSTELRTPMLSRPLVLGVFALIALAAGIASGFGVRFATENPNREDREARIDAMSAAEKSALGDKLERFRAMSEKDRQTLVDNYAEIENSANAEELKYTMVAYYDWLKSLRDPIKRAELRGSNDPPEVRAELVAKIRFEEGLPPLRRGERELLAAWLRKHIISQLPEEDGIVADDDEEIFALAFVKWIHPRSTAVDNPRRIDYLELANEFSKEVRDVFETAQDSYHYDAVANWITYWAHRSVVNWRTDQQDLWTFIDGDMTDLERERLAQLDSQSTRPLLTLFYLTNRDPDWWKDAGRGRGRRGGGRGRGDGDGRRGGRGGG